MLVRELLVDGQEVDAAGLLKLMSLASSAAELDRVADVSARVVNATAATLALAEATHEGKVVTLNRAAGVAVTLPAATGSGARYELIVGTAVTSNSITVKVAASTDESMKGHALGADDDGEGATGYTWMAEDADDTVTMNGTATGGKVGDRWVFTDIGSGLWHALGTLTQSGGSEATPFSATVSAS